MDFAPANENPLDPFPQYERMREAAPVFHDEQSGSWHVFRYDDVQRVLSEHARFSSRMGGDDPSETGQLFASSLITTDPPRHRQLRSLVTQAFTPKAVDALAPRISELTDELLDGDRLARNSGPDPGVGVPAAGDRDLGTHGHTCR